MFIGREELGLSANGRKSIVKLSLVSREVQIGFSAIKGKADTMQGRNLVEEEQIKTSHIGRLLPIEKYWEERAASLFSEKPNYGMVFEDFR